MCYLFPLKSALMGATLGHVLVSQNFHSENVSVLPAFESYEC